MLPPARDLVAAALADALARAAAAQGWQGAANADVDVEIPANPTHGDYATSVAMRLAKTLRRSPRDIATALAAQVSVAPPIAAVEVAGGGFVNVRLDDTWLRRQVGEIAAAGDAYGRSDRLAGRKIQIEFISANPTGPLTLANARGGPLGDVLSSVLAFAGAEVQREYYVEDGGTQVKRFGESVAVRYRQLFGEDVELPADGYQGDYVKDIAAQIKERHGARYRDLSIDEQGKRFAPLAIDWVVADAQRVTGKFGIRFDSWFKQSSFLESGYFEKTMAELRARGVIVERDGAVWFETPEAQALSREGDEGWVVIRSNGDPTYLGTDIAYHRLCLEERGVDHKLDVWGANTHYHLQQMKIALPALGIDPARFEVVLYQYVRFLKEGVLQRMGRRTGQFLLLEDVLDAVGADVTRFFLLQRGADSPLDFDFELAVQQSNDNPVYYVQYAHARIASILRTAAERGLSADGGDVQLLTAPAERDLIRLCQKLPELLADIVEHRGVHLLTVYALELAGAFHGFYRDHRVVDGANAELSRARLRLVQAVQVTLRQTLRLLGVSAPDSM
ncbi:MAG TPA: arginine--tRNA ligase [Candidatus Limnocylindria bacterium]|nr:arginine--tRNA ligase [Candidatus Limnocylindria bacterium]